MSVFEHSKKGGSYQILHSFLIGSFSKVLADSATYPLGLIKTRYESEVYNYRSVSNAFRNIIKREGFWSLYKGLSATLTRDITYSGVYFTLYTKIKFQAKKSDGSNEKSLFFASCALASALVACLVTQPTDVIRAYMQLEPQVNKTFVLAFKNIYKRHGVCGFFAGFIPRSIRRTLISVMSWTLYEKLTLIKPAKGSG